MKHRGKIIFLAYFAAVALGVVVGGYSRAEEGHQQTWVIALGYVELALLAVVVILTLTGLAKLVRRTFEDTRRPRA